MDQPSWLLPSSKGFEPRWEVVEEDAPFLDDLGDEEEHHGSGVGHDYGGWGRGEGLAEGID